MLYYFFNNLTLLHHSNLVLIYIVAEAEKNIQARNEMTVKLILFWIYLRLRKFLFLN